MIDKNKDIIFTHGDHVLSIDNTGRLYWNDKPIVTEQRIKLSSAVNLAVIVGGVSTLVIAICEAWLVLQKFL